MAETSNLVTRREWRFAILTALLATALTMVPYLLGYLTTRAGWVYMGLVMNPEDSQTYFAKMQQGFDGRWLYTIPFTIEIHEPAFVGTFYIGLGHLARWLGLSLAAVWQWARAAADLFMFLVTYRFIAAFIKQVQVRRTSYLLAIFGSGLGWLLFLMNQPYWLDAFPVDFKQPGAHLFFSALTFPHVAVGTGLTMLSLLLSRRLLSEPMTRKRRWAAVAAAGATNILLGIAYPFLIYLVMLASALFWLLQLRQRRRIPWPESLSLAAAFLIPAPLFIYFALTLQSNAVFSAWDAQAGTPALPWPHYLVAYGLMLALAALDWLRHKESRSQFALLWVWVLAVALLLYAPLGPQRRFVQGVQVPLAIMTAAAFHRQFLPWLQRRRAWQTLVSRPRYTTPGLARLMTVLFLIFMSLSNIYVLASTSITAAYQQPDTLFRPANEVAAVEWLRQYGRKNSIVLTSYLTGSYVGARSAQRAAAGHWAETMAFAEKQADIEKFFDETTSDGWRRELLQRYGAGYVWLGPRERELGRFDPSATDYLVAVFIEGDITIYDVRP